MQLYLSKGRHWTGTQADAKEAQGGKDFETIEVPDRKPDRIDWLNRMWAKLLGDEHKPVMIRANDGEVRELVIPEVVEEAPAPKGPTSMAPGKCGECGRTEPGYHLLQQGEIKDAIIFALDEVDQPWVLKQIAEALRERHAVLAQKEAA